MDLAERDGINLEGAVTWAFEFEDQPIFAGFRVLASRGVDLPVLNVLRMFGQMKGERLPTESTGAVALDDMVKSGVRGTPDVAALASGEAGKVCIMLWHYHDDDLPGPDAAVELNVSGLPAGFAQAKAHCFRVDQDHGNAYNVWKGIGAPAEPSAEQMALLEQAGKLEASAEKVDLRMNGTTGTTKLTLPRQGVMLLVLE